MAFLPTIILVVVGLQLAFAEEMYSNKYDNVDVDVILHSDRLLKRYMDCVLEKGPCSADGRYFRSILPDALATNCSKCTRKMKLNIRKVSKHIKKERPDDWESFVKKYDADGKYKQSYERFLDE
ncbi:ejaculatory bulb-specific protein 3-like [Athalia rosae]|uniref:ejaculatory bulb-specific protein 3-like n=1 Tax=Athalia rosae TaxID=37344 RepID=UPI00203410EC|nr:ejaculatory bulb-specific protein 3-like [Athalia rosae]XP_048510044.1 ejaculatory bulb-specific protein 3-like [Athalia rosae]